MLPTNTTLQSILDVCLALPGLQCAPTTSTESVSLHVAATLASSLIQLKPSVIRLAQLDNTITLILEVACLAPRMQ